LISAEKGLKRLWEAYTILKKLPEENSGPKAENPELDEKINKLIDEFEEFINDDFNTAKVLANMFEIVPTINSFKDGLIPLNSIAAKTLLKLKNSFFVYLEEILGLKDIAENTDQINGLLDLLIEIRKEAKSKKDFLTSDKIRKQLASLGIEMKDEKNGNMSWSRI
jgi:cysteinyl-tRNA synthetase